VPTRAGDWPDFLDLDLHERRERDVRRRRKKKEEIRFYWWERKKREETDKIDTVGGWNDI
jgi:hypothetical protein